MCWVSHNAGGKDTISVIQQTRSLVENINECKVLNKEKTVLQKYISNPIDLRNIC